MATRESLLDVAARLYAEHGWRGTTTRRIAEVAGVNEVTIFRQFGSKESLLLEAIQQASLNAGIPSLPDVPRNLAAELSAWAIAHHESIAQTRGIIRACLAESEERPELAPTACESGRLALGDAVRYLTRASERGLIGSGGSIESAAVMLINSVFLDAITRDLIPGSTQRPVVEVIDSFVELILRGLGAKELA